MDGESAYCPACGAPLQDGELYCTQCGINVQPLQGKSETIEWNNSIPPGDLLKDSLFVLGLAVLITWGIIEAISVYTGHSFTGAIITGIAKNDPYLGYAAAFIGFWLLLSFFVCWLIFGKGYAASYGLDGNSVWMDTQPEQRRTNKIINTLLFWLALLSRKPGAMGTAILANASQSAAYGWEQIYQIVPKPERNIIVLKNKWRPLLRLYCTQENYAQVLGMVQQYFAEYQPMRQEFDKQVPGQRKSVLQTILSIAVVGIAGVMLGQSPLLDENMSVISLAVSSVLACITGGGVRRGMAYISLAIILGLIIGMVINALAPMGDYYLRYYRYERLERMPYTAEFAVSCIGVILISVINWRFSRE